tara:strand:- start:903 stop:1157 length:255 start_codon:yes stop_codon:yes gene_type:complete
MANDTAVSDGTITVRVLNGAQFTTRRTKSRTVGALRTELGLPANAEMSVNSETVDADHPLAEDDIVAATVDNKNGGKTHLLLTQ